MRFKSALPPKIVVACTSNSAFWSALDEAVTVSEFMDTTFKSVSLIFTLFSGAPFIKRSVNLFDAFGVVGMMFRNDTLLVPPFVTEFPE